MTTNHQELLSSFRKFASQKSGGISSFIIYRLILNIIRENRLKGNLLDFGAGKGQFTELLLQTECDFNITSVDLMERPRNLDPSVNWIVNDLNGILNFNDHQFDVLVSIEVIEHLENPRSVVREWFRLLKPGGILIFSTPNNESWRSVLSLIIQGHFVAFSDNCYPEHITALLRKDIIRILSESGFSSTEFISTNIGGLPKLPNITWQSISGGLFRGIRFSDNIIICASKPYSITNI